MERSSSRSAKQISTELKRRGFDSAGAAVMDSVDSRLQRFQLSEQQFGEILDHPVGACRRSDLVCMFVKHESHARPSVNALSLFGQTTPSSLKQYVSLYDHSTVLSTPDVIFLSGRKMRRLKSPVLVLPETQSVSLAKRASRLGIDIGSRHESSFSDTPSISPVHRRRSIPPFFEQVNDDMFARKDNKFMVFNGAGADLWHGKEPITRVLKPDDFFFVDSSIPSCK